MSSVLARSINRVAPQVELNTLASRSRPLVLEAPATPGMGSAPAPNADPYNDGAPTKAWREAVSLALALPPVGSRPDRIAGSYTDAVSATGTTNHDLVSGVVPRGFRFVARQRISLIDTTTATVRGGIVIYRNDSVLYDGAGIGSPWGVPANDGGEWIGGTSLDSKFEFIFEPGDKITLKATVVRGAGGASVALHGSLIGILVPV
jgi:hypothetical protein